MVNWLRDIIISEQQLCATTPFTKVTGISFTSIPSLALSGSGLPTICVASFEIKRCICADGSIAPERAFCFTPEWLHLWWHHLEPVPAWQRMVLPCCKCSYLKLGSISQFSNWKSWCRVCKVYKQNSLFWSVPICCFHELWRAVSIYLNINVPLSMDGSTEEEGPVFNNAIAPIKDPLCSWLCTFRVSTRVVLEMVSCATRCTTTVKLLAQLCNPGQLCKGGGLLLH